jgi:hypothetical protein
VIRIKDFGPETVAQMIDFLYTGKYDTVSTTTKEPSEASTATAAVAAEDHDMISAEAEHGSALIQHIKVNAIADYYNIKTLSERSSHHIKELLATHSDPASILSASSLVLSTTGDQALQGTMAHAISKSLGVILSEEGQTKSLAGLITDFGVTVIRHQAQQQKELHATVETLKKKLKTSEDRVKRVLDNFETCHERLRTLEKCTNTGHCTSQFGVILDKGGQPWEPKYTLRCSRCARRYN